MRSHLLKVLFSLLVLTVLGVSVGATPASAHHGGQHTFYVNGSFDIFDDEPWPVGGVWCRHSLNYAPNVWYPGDRMVLSLGLTCDGEIRVEFMLTGSVQADGRLCPSLEINFYEGRSTSTNDLDGTLYTNYSCMSPNTTKRVTGGRVVNSAEGGDYANFGFTLQYRVA